jgi:two-component system cell cycle sensor histidine kinase PleC
MLQATSRLAPRSPSLLADYASLLGGAVLRHRTRTAEQIARMEAELANRLKSEFIANMSHELRTPLNTVIGFSKLIAEQPRRPLPPEEIAEYAGLIRDAASHLLALLNDILDLSRLQSGRYRLTTEDVDLGEIVAAVRSSLHLTAGEAGVTLVADVADGLPAVQADAVKVRQVLTNLVSNAIKFTPRGGRVAIAAAPTPTGAVEILVRDTGIGMAPAEVTVALTPFGQVDGSRTRCRDGAGLGLPIAKSLVELHGGSLRIDSTPGVGTVVHTVWPRQPPAATAVPYAPSPRS